MRGTTPEFDSARLRLRRWMFSKRARWLGFSRQDERDDREQNACLAYFGLNVSERPENEDAITQFLIGHAKCDSQTAKKRELLFSQTVNRIIDAGINSESHETFVLDRAYLVRTLPNQEEYVDAHIIVSFLPKLPGDMASVAILLAEGASPIDIKNETKLSLVKIMQIHKAIPMTLMRLMDDERQERQERQECV